MSTGISRCIVLLCLSAAVLPLHASSAVFQGLGKLDPNLAINHSEARAVSGDGNIVVGRSLPNLQIPQESAFMWKPDTGIVKMNFPALSRALAYDISDNGSDVLIAGNGSFHYVRSTTLGTRWIGDLGLGGEGKSISGDGKTVVGQRVISTSPPVRHAFSHTFAGGIRALDFEDASDVSYDGKVIGGEIRLPRPGSTNTYDTKPYAWRDGTGTVLVPEATTGGVYAVSGDGSTFAGYYTVRKPGVGNTGSWYYTFVYKDGVGVTQIDFVDDVPNVSEDEIIMGALALSADGSVLVGEKIYPGLGVGGHRAVMWTQQRGIRRVADVLANDYGVDMTGWTLTRATDISADGKVIVGWGTNPQGEREAWRVYLDPDAIFQVTEPAENEIVKFGETYSIRFSTTPDINAVNLYLVERSLQNGGERTLIAEDVPAAAGVFEWEVPEDMLSPSTFIIAVDADDETREVSSSRFRVRHPWYLFRVAGSFQNPEYEPFYTDDNAISFLPQEEDVFWHPDYYDVPGNHYDDRENGQDYHYIDVRYHPYFFSSRIAAEYPSWNALVGAFGTNAAYASLQPFTLGGVRWNQPNPDAATWWNWEIINNGLYHGACYGNSMLMMSAFADRERFGQRWPLLGSPDFIGEIAKSDYILDAVHAMHLTQFGRVEQSLMVLNQGSTRPREAITRLKAMLERDDRTRDRVLLFQSEVDATDSDGNPLSGGHAVLPISLERVDDGAEDEDGIYYIGVVDPNYGPDRPDGEENPRYVIVDEAQDSWTTEDGYFKGETGTGLYLSVEVEYAYGPASTQWAHTPQDEFASLVPLKLVGRNPAVTSPAGELRVQNGVQTSTLPGGTITYPFTGGPSAPGSFIVPAGTAYRAEVTPRADGTAGVNAPGQTLTTSLLQTRGSSAQKTIVDLPGDGVKVVSGGAGTFALSSLKPIAPGEYQSIRVTGLSTGNPAGLQLSATGSGFQVKAPVQASTYDVEITVVTPEETRLFRHDEVSLPAGATQVITPQWESLGEGPVAIATDLDSDGETDESSGIHSDPISNNTSWAGWGIVTAAPRLEMRMGAGGSPEFRVVSPGFGNHVIEYSGDLVEWTTGGSVLANTWVALGSLEDFPAGGVKGFVRIRQGRE